MEVEVVVGRGETIKREDIPATSKQMTDHRPGGSVSTAPAAAAGGNGGISEQKLRCQSVHHPLQVSFHHRINLRHNLMSAERKKPHCCKNKQTLTCWYARPLLFTPSL